MNKKNEEYKEASINKLFEILEQLQKDARENKDHAYQKAIDKLRNL